MLTLNLGRLLGRTDDSSVVEFVRPSATQPAEPANDAGVTTESAGPWPPERMAVTDRLWGPGFNLPGGESEILRLVRPLGASGDNRLLLVGMGGGSSATTIVRVTHARVTGFESEPALLEAAKARAEAEHLARKITMETWDPRRPALPKGNHRNCLALEPMRHAVCSVALPALAASIEKGGGLMVVDLITTEPLNAADPVVIRWLSLDGREPNAIPTSGAVAAVMEACGMDLRIAEDISQRHMDQTVDGWRSLVAAMAQHKPTRREAAFVVSEAELWLLRHRLIETGALRMMRWHAIKTR